MSTIGVQEFYQSVDKVVAVVGEQIVLAIFTRIAFGPILHFGEITFAFSFASRPPRDRALRRVSIHFVRFIITQTPFENLLTEHE
jgi:hypothetical protein